MVVANKAAVVLPPTPTADPQNDGILFRHRNTTRQDIKLIPKDLEGLSRALSESFGFT